MKPGWIPYKWFWVLGALLLVISLITAIQGVVWLPLSFAFAGVMMIVLGFVERHRGAPPL